MSKLYLSRDVEYVLHVKLNFRFISQKGSHGKYKNEKGYIAILPMNKRNTCRDIQKYIIKTNADWFGRIRGYF